LIESYFKNDKDGKEPNYKIIDMYLEDVHSELRWDQLKILQILTRYQWKKAYFRIRQQFLENDMSAEETIKAIENALSI
jgi:hypothetical protein